MRLFSMLAPLSMAVALSLTAAPVTAQQDGSATEVSGPLALVPDGRLPLEGTTWRLQSYRRNGVERTPGPEIAAVMRLSAGKLQASGGCTTFRGAYGVVGSAISFDLKRLKGSDCDEQTMLAQLGMIDGLRKAARYEIVTGADGDEDELVLHSAIGTELLRFTLDDIAALDIGEWRLESYTVDGQRTVADPDQPAVLTFRPRRENEARRSSSGRLDASSGCNAIVGEFYRHANTISFGELERTDAPCAPALEAQEQAMVSVLDAASSRLDLPPDRLRVTSIDDGDSLELVATQPLEGSTWLLSKVSGSERSPDPVVLWLDGGAATGEGPCGAFSASYATDGHFLSFTDISAASGEDCQAEAIEWALLAALRATVRVDHDQPQLRLLDARGRIVARFTPPSGP